MKVGTIIHFYDKLGVGIAKLDSPLKKGDTITVKDKDNQDIFTQVVTSLEIEHQSVDQASKDSEVGLKLDQPVKEGWTLYTG